MIYEYGVMSNKYSVEADNKLTAYAVMLLQFSSNPMLVAIYSPEESRQDSWLMLMDGLEKRIDDIYGGEGSFEKYIKEHQEEIRNAFKTVKKLV